MSSSCIYELSNNCMIWILIFAAILPLLFLLTCKRWLEVLLVHIVFDLFQSYNSPFSCSENSCSFCAAILFCYSLYMTWYGSNCRIAHLYIGHDNSIQSPIFSLFQNMHARCMQLSPQFWLHYSIPFTPLSIFWHVGQPGAASAGAWTASNLLNHCNTPLTTL